MREPAACSHHDRHCMATQRTPNSLWYSHDVDLQLSRASIWLWADYLDASGHSKSPATEDVIRMLWTSSPWLLSAAHIAVFWTRSITTMSTTWLQMCPFTAALWWWYGLHVQSFRRQKPEAPLRGVTRKITVRRWWWSMARPIITDLVDSSPAGGSPAESKRHTAPLRGFTGPVVPSGTTGNSR